MNLILYSLGYIALAGYIENHLGAIELKPQVMSVPRAIMKQSRVELSGLVFDQTTKKFITVTDDTDSKKSPWLLKFSQNGVMDKDVIKISYLEKVSDLESMSTFQNYLILLSSQNKPFKENDSHGLILLEKNTQGYQKKNFVKIKDSFYQWVNESKNINLVELKKELRDSILDVESHFILVDDLYFILKSPLGKSGKSALIKIKDLSEIWTSNEILPDHFEFIQWLEFSKSQKNMVVSDMTIDDSQIYFSLVDKAEPKSYIFKAPLSELKGKMEIKPVLFAFANESHLEGITITPDHWLWGVFDTGSNIPRYFKLKIDSN